MKIRRSLRCVLLASSISVAGLAASPSAVLARIGPREHEAIVRWTRVGVCSEARKVVSAATAAKVVYELAQIRFGLSREQVDDHIDQPTFAPEVERGIVRAGGCDEILRNADSLLMN